MRVGMIVSSYANTNVKGAEGAKRDNYHDLSLKTKLTLYYPS